MTSRESLRQQETGTKSRKHWFSSLIGIVAATALLLCLLLNTTVFNENFVVKELSNTSLTSQIEGQINDSFKAYGLSGDVVSHQQTEKLLKTAIGQVYEGKTVHLDLSEIVNKLQSQSSDALGGYQLPAALTDSIDNSVNSIVDSKINSSQLMTIEQNLQKARKIVNVTLIVSILILMMIAIYDIFSASFLRDIRWIFLFSPFLFGMSLYAVRSELASQLINDSTWEPIVNRLIEAVCQRGLYLGIIMLALSGLFFAFSIIRRHKA